MSKSGNTWFKIKRTKGRKVGFLNVKVIAPAMVTMDWMELVRHGEVKRKAYKPRERWVPVGRDLSGIATAKAKAARRAAYFASLGMA